MQNNLWTQSRKFDSDTLIYQGQVINKQGPLYLQAPP